MKLLVDMNLSPAWVDFLVANDFEARHWSRVGRPDAEDREVLRWAAGNGYIVLTNDLDFGAILAATQEQRPSVLLLRSDLLTPAAVGATVVAAVRQCAQELRAGALVSVDAVRARLRVLPLNG